MSNAQRFLDGYLDAWRTNDPDTIRGLFTPDASYRSGPGDVTPVVGADAIVVHWLEEQDLPGTWTYEGRVEQETSTAAMIRGVTSYSDGPKSGAYDNTWLLHFDADGRASEFQDWWFERTA